MGTSSRRILKINLSKDFREVKDDEVVVEAFIELYVNDELLFSFTATPEELKELAVGLLLSEGILEKLSDLESVDIEDKKIYVQASHSIESRLRSYRKLKPSKPTCGGGLNVGFKLRALDSLTVKPIPSNLKVNQESILEAASKLRGYSKIYRKTGGTHSAAIFNSEAELLSFAEDIGRHNAVDKAIGSAVLRNIDLESSFLFCSGRLSLEVVLKAIRVGIPIVSSISAPTSLGIEAADQNKVTLIGFVRGKRFNVYSHPWRIHGLETLQVSS
ncbi:MAG: formate dehydrogenase accessory sulfurtransferase FdhD [Thermoprotei archaeon]|nr:MAG: formate dehydrogenase accessory sulfurtransferase FdhD [Thermoprotei archaeon]